MQRNEVTTRRAATLLVALCGSVLMSGCADPMLRIRADYDHGRYELAGQALEDLVRSDGQNAHVYNLERGVVELARGRPEQARKALAEARDRLDKLGRAGYLEWFGSAFVDDALVNYRGADFEHVLVRALLAVADLAAGGTDSSAYALQVGAKQLELIEEFQTDDGKRPKSGYKLVAFGYYLRAILDEAKLDYAGAERNFKKAYELEPQYPFADEDIHRVTEGRHSKQGNGVVHIVALVGRGPHRVESHEAGDSRRFRHRPVCVVDAARARNSTQYRAGESSCAGVLPEQSRRCERLDQR